MERQGNDKAGAWIRGLTEPRLSRRRFIQGSAGLAAAVTVGGALSGCGLPGTRDTGAPADFDWTAWWAKQKKTDSIDFANWPLYIDTEKGKHPSIEDFTAKTGIGVKYQPVIQDNASFFSQISPVLQAEQSIGYDLVVLSNGWQLTQMIQNRWAIPLDHSRLPNFKKYGGWVAKDLSYDPGAKYCAVWQAGVTGIAYNPDLTDGPIDSTEALFDPKYKGKVGMLSDSDELGTVGLITLGYDPAKTGLKEWGEAADLLTRQRDAGIVRQYYDNSYIKALEDGDLAVCQAYSGDVFQANNSGYPKLKFVIPKQGAVLWRDNCMIPLHSSNPLAALEWIDFYYRPEIQAQIEDWVNYICPVPAAQPIIRNQLDDPGVADSPLVFPSPATRKKLYEYPLTETIETHDEWIGLFDPIIQS